MKSRRFWLTLFAGLLGSVACTGPAPEAPAPSPTVKQGTGNPFQDQVVTGEPPPVETRGTLELRVVHAAGGVVHPAWVALLRTGQGRERVGAADGEFPSGVARLDRQASDHLLSPFLREV